MTAMKLNLCHFLKKVLIFHHFCMTSNSPAIFIVYSWLYHVLHYDDLFANELHAVISCDELQLFSMPCLLPESVAGYCRFHSFLLSKQIAAL